MRRRRAVQQHRRLEAEQPGGERHVPHHSVRQLAPHDPAADHGHPLSKINSFAAVDVFEKIAAEKYPRARLEFRYWLTGSFVTSPMSSNPAIAGIRTAILGSLWVLLLTILAVSLLGEGVSKALAGRKR